MSNNEQVYNLDSDLLKRSAQNTLRQLVANGLVTSQLVAGRAGMQTLANSNGTDTGMNSRTFHQVGPAGACDIRLRFTNDKPPAVDGNGPITVRAGVAVAIGAARVAVYFNGQRDVTIQPGATVESDPIGIYIPPNGVLECVTRVTMSGVIFVGRGSVSSLGEGVESGTSTTDKTLTGTIAPSWSYTYGPSAILGGVTNKAPNAGIIGDSISMGQGETTTSGIAAGDANGNVGWVERALGSSRIPFLNTSLGGDTCNLFVAVNGSRMRMELLRTTARTVMFCMGANDLANFSLSVCQANFIAAWQLLAARGLAVIQPTVTPTSTSTDSWATVANQTPKAWSGPGSKIAQFNDWIRDGAPIVAGVAAAVGTVNAIRIGSSSHPLKAYIEVADQVESARNSGVFKAPGYTTDGLHPTTVGHTAIATAVNARLAVLV